MRHAGNGFEILAFVHPSAGKQLVKGTIEPGERPLAAAVRELREESGLTFDEPPLSLGHCRIAGDAWHFFKWMSHGLPDDWAHQTEDDFGHVFRFFWHPLPAPLGPEWHPIYREAYEFLLGSKP